MIWTEKKQRHTLSSLFFFFWKPLIDSIYTRLSTESWWFARQTTGLSGAHSSLPGSPRGSIHDGSFFSVPETPEPSASGCFTRRGLQQDVLLLNIHSCFHLSPPWSLRLDHPPHQTQSHPAPGPILTHPSSPLALLSSWLSLDSLSPDTQSEKLHYTPSIFPQNVDDPELEGMGLLLSLTHCCLLSYSCTGGQTSCRQRACLRCLHILVPGEVLPKTTTSKHNAWRAAFLNWEVLWYLISKTL